MDLFSNNISFIFFLFFILLLDNLGLLYMGASGLLLRLLRHCTHNAMRLLSSPEAVFYRGHQDRACRQGVFQRSQQVPFGTVRVLHPVRIPGASPSCGQRL